jgi:large subunit ribosomal protein L21
MYAVIKTGGKQYRVAANDVIEIEKVSGKVGDWVQFAEVLMVGGETAEIGAPLVKGASVAAEIEDQGRADKVVIFKKRRRHNYRRKKGHRQHLTTVRITEILTGGKAPSQTALPAIWNAELGRIATPRPIVPNGHHSASRKTGRSQAVRFVGVAAAKGGHDHDHDGHDHAGHDHADHDHAGHSHGAKAKADAPKATGTDSYRLLTAPEGAADDLGRIGGVADKTAEVLNRNGIFHFWQVAAMTDDDAAKMEKVLKFPGRIRREEWREQARELMAGHAPRAKSDQVGDMASGRKQEFKRLTAPLGGKADELGLISGVADKTEKLLNAHGIFHFWQVAAMTSKDISVLEQDLKFPGRVRREEWQAQARELIAGKPPRAKVDRERS